MFFLPSSFRFCPPLKNDGRVVFVLPWRSDLYTQTCPYRLARLGTSLRIRGKLTLRKKAIKFLYSKNKNKEMTHTKKPSPLVGEGGGVSRRKGQVWADMKNSFLQNGIKKCPSFLNEVKNLAKNTGVKYVFCGYPMPDSSLRVRLCFFFHHHSDSAHRSRMTARVNCVSRWYWMTFWRRRKGYKPQAVPACWGKCQRSWRKGQAWAETEK